jgi:hypothetical protein
MRANCNLQLFARICADYKSTQNRRNRLKTWISRASVAQMTNGFLCFIQEVLEQHTGSLNICFNAFVMYLQKVVDLK